MIPIANLYPYRAETRRRPSRGYKLSLMHSCRPQKLFTVVLNLGLCFAFMSCRRDVKSNPEDSGKTIVPTAANTLPATVNTGWDESAAGQFMILSAADDGISAALVLPGETDSTLSSSRGFQIDSFANTAVDLFSTAGAVGKSS